LLSIHKELDCTLTTIDLTGFWQLLYPDALRSLLERSQEMYMGISFPCAIKMMVTFSNQQTVYGMITDTDSFLKYFGCWTE